MSKRGKILLIAILGCVFSWGMLFFIISIGGV